MSFLDICILIGGILVIPGLFAVGLFFTLKMGAKFPRQEDLDSIIKSSYTWVFLFKQTNKLILVREYTERYTLTNCKFTEFFIASEEEPEGWIRFDIKSIPELINSENFEFLGEL